MMPFPPELSGLIALFLVVKIFSIVHNGQS
jgi:hypothetical protein